MATMISARVFLAALAVQAVCFAQPVPPPPAAPAAPPAPESRAIRMMSLGGPVSYLGIGVKEIVGDRAKELKLKEEAGVEVTRVDADSPAEKAGLKAGDVVLEYQGTRVEGVEQFVRFVRETPVGRKVRLKISRAGSGQTLEAAIGARQQNRVMGLSKEEQERLQREMGRLRERLQNMPEIRVPDVPRPYMTWSSGMLGIDGEALQDQLAEFFAVKEGVLVRSVVKDLPAEKAGIKTGDVITKIEDVRVKTPREITSAIRAAKNRRPLKVTVMRQKSEMVVDVTLEDDKSSRTPQRAVTVTVPQDEDF